MTDTFSSLKDRVAIITGGGQGIGRAYAHRFAAEGAIPVIAEINTEAGQRVAGEIAQQGRDALAVETDVADAESVKNMVETTVARYGRADILVNNAAFFSKIEMRPFYEIPDEEWDLALRVNVSGCFLCAKAVLPHMRAHEWGRIINISSTVMDFGRAHYLHYVTSKSAMMGMTRSMARELGEFGITVNSVMPGLTITEVPRDTNSEQHMQDTVARQCIKRPERPEDVVGAIMFLCSDSAAFITGQSLVVDGGLYFR